MKAYHGDPAVKEKYLARVREHRAADEILQAFGYWKGGKGCAVGCTIHGEDHARYETELGIHQAIARLEDHIFESLPNDLAKVWPERFLEAAPVAADLGGVIDRFLLWLLADEKHGVAQWAKREDAKKAILDVADAYRKKIAGEKISADEWRTLLGRSRATFAAADADAAAADADAAAAAYAAAARKQWYVAAGERLLELMREAPVANN